MDRSYGIFHVSERTIMTRNGTINPKWHLLNLFYGSKCLYDDGNKYCNVVVMNTITCFKLYWYLFWVEFAVTANFHRLTFARLIDSIFCESFIYKTIERLRCDKCERPYYWLLDIDKKCSNVKIKEKVTRIASNRKLLEIVNFYIICFSSNQS